MPSASQAAANQALRSLSAASDGAAQAILDTGLLHCIHQQLTAVPGDGTVKASAFAAVTSLVRQSGALAAAVAQEKLLAATADILRKPPPPQRTVIDGVGHEAVVRAGVNFLEAVAASSAAGADAVLGAHPLPALTALCASTSAGSYLGAAAALRALARIAEHSTTSASAVAGAEGLVAAAMRHAADDLHDSVRHAACELLAALARRTAALAEAVASGGCAMALVLAADIDRGTPALAVVLEALGYVGGYATSTALAVRRGEQAASGTGARARETDA